MVISPLPVVMIIAVICISSVWIRRIYSGLIFVVLLSLLKVKYVIIFHKYYFSNKHDILHILYTQ